MSQNHEIPQEREDIEARIMSKMGGILPIGVEDEQPKPDTEIIVAESSAWSRQEEEREKPVKSENKPAVRKRRKAVVGLIAIGLSGGLAVMRSGSDDVTRSAQYAETTTTFVTPTTAETIISVHQAEESPSSVETTTTAPLVIAEGQTSYTVQENDTLFKIAHSAGIAYPELLELNPEITNPDTIHVGQVIHLIAAPATTETTPVPETVPTVPVAAPETTAETTTETTPEVSASNDGTLTRAECAKAGGTSKTFAADGRGSWAIYRDYYGLTEYQVGRIMKTDIPDTYHSRQITASTPEYPVYECMPDSSVIHDAAPVASPPTTSA